MVGCYTSFTCVVTQMCSDSVTFKLHQEIEQPQEQVFPAQALWALQASKQASRL